MTYKDELLEKLRRNTRTVSDAQHTDRRHIVRRHGKAVCGYEHVGGQQSGDG